MFSASKRATYKTWSALWCIIFLILRFSGAVLSNNLVVRGSYNKSIHNFNIDESHAPSQTKAKSLNHANLFRPFSVIVLFDGYWRENNNTFINQNSPHILYLVPNCSKLSVEKIKMSSIAVGRHPVTLVCPACKATVITTMDYKPTMKTHLCGLCLFLFG